MSGDHLLVFARIPESGRVKTRIGGELGEQVALDLHISLLQHTLRSLAGGGPWHTRLWLYPHGEHPLIRQLQQEHAFSIHLQQGDDLGRRMGHAAQQSLSAGKRVVLVGTDCPQLSAERISDLFSALDQGHDAALVPAEDGGYVALALARYAPQLFTGIDWGTDRVCAHTREILRDLGWRCHLDTPLWDVDRPEDLARLRQSRLVESIS